MVATQGRPKQAGDEQQREHPEPWSAIDVHARRRQVAWVDRRYSGCTCGLTWACHCCGDNSGCRSGGCDHWRQCCRLTLDDYTCRRHRHAHALCRRRKHPGHCRCRCSALYPSLGLGSGLRLRQRSARWFGLPDLLGYRRRCFNNFHHTRGGCRCCRGRSRWRHCAG